MAIFNAGFNVEICGEYFWHATTIENTLKMISSENLKPIGNGQMGNGFYVTGERSDYMKAMARRQRQTENAPLFLFYVGVKNFYRLNPSFLTEWSHESTGSDFSAVCWYKGGPGAVGIEEPGGFMPDKNDGKRRDFKYGEYQQERMFGTTFSEFNREEQGVIMRELWERCFEPDASKRLLVDLPPESNLNRLGDKFRSIDCRKIFKSIFLELAFKNAEILKTETAIVGVKVFSPTCDPINLNFNCNGKNYNLKDAVIDEQALRKEKSPLNYHEEICLDLGKMVADLT